MIRRWCVWLLVWLWGACGVAGASDLVGVQCPDNFRLQNVDVAQDGTLLLSGAAGPVMEAKPMLMRVSTAGKVLWSMTDDAKDDALYRDAIYLEDGSIAALRSAKNWKWVVQIIRDGKVEAKSKALKDVFGLRRAGGGLFTYGDMGNNKRGVLKMDGRGKALFRVRWPRPLLMNGVLVGPGAHVAFGDKLVSPKKGQDQESYGMVAAFDDAGKVLWRHDSATKCSFLAAAWAGDGRVVVAGYDEDGRRTGCIAEYGPDGQVWKTALADLPGGAGRAQVGEIESILAVEGGYLALNGCYDEPGNARLVLVDGGGAVQRVWDVPIGDVHVKDHVRLYRVGEEIYLLANGRVNPGNAKTLKNVPSATVLRKIDLAA